METAQQPGSLKSSGIFSQYGPIIIIVAVSFFIIIVLLYTKRQTSARIFNRFLNGERSFTWRESGADDASRILESNNDQ